MRNRDSVPRQLVLHTSSAKLPYYEVSLQLFTRRCVTILNYVCQQAAYWQNITTTNGILDATKPLMFYENKNVQ